MSTKVLLLQPLLVTPQPKRHIQNTIQPPTEQWNSKWRSNFTPTRERGRCGKASQHNIKQHRHRQDNCLGIVLCHQADNKRLNCELCGRPSQFYYSGCSSILWFNPLTDVKIKAIIEKLQLPSNTDISKTFKLTRYNPTYRRSDAQHVLSFCTRKEIY